MKNASENNTFCLQFQTFDKLADFTECLLYFIKENVFLTTFGLILFILALITNGILIFKLFKCEKTIFDLLAISHSIMDIITTLIDYPIYYIQNLFGYSPFNQIITLLWGVYDNNINTTTSLHMVYMAFVLLRSVKAPYDFKSELLIKRPKLTVLCIWIIGFTIWTPITLSYGIVPHTLDINFKYPYQKFILSLLFWFMILIVLLIIGLALMRNINSLKNKRITVIAETNTKRNKTINNRIKRIRSINLHSQLKIVLLVFTFWLQWVIPCTLYLLSSIFDFISDEAMNKVYWLTYTVCLTDPIVIFLLNPNISLNKTPQNTQTNS